MKEPREQHKELLDRIYTIPASELWGAAYGETLHYILNPEPEGGFGPGDRHSELIWRGFNQNKRLRLGSVNWSDYYKTYTCYIDDFTLEAVDEQPEAWSDCVTAVREAFKQLLAFKMAMTMTIQPLHPRILRPEVGISL